MKVFLSAGHGGKDPGAQAYGLKEKDVVLDIMLACRDELKKSGVTVVTSRTKDENDPVEQEVKEANKSGASVAVSFHANAGGGDGSETYYFSKDSKGKKLAQLCEDETKKIGQNSRGIKHGDGLWWIRKTNMTAVLCECAFVDNKKDKSIIDSKDKRKKFGVAYAKAILKYLGITHVENSTTNKDNRIAIAEYLTQHENKRYMNVYAGELSDTEYTGYHNVLMTIKTAGARGVYSDYDSKNHKVSGTKMDYTKEKGTKILVHVIHRFK